MKIIHDEVLLQKSIAELNLESVFDIRKMNPFLCSYAKGELLSGPHIRQKYLLFVVSGLVQIYGTSLDGRMIPVNLAQKGSLIGDVEFCNAHYSNLFSEVVREALCIGIPIADNRKFLDNDIRFLHYLLKVISAKVYLTSVQEVPAVSVEEKLIQYMQKECTGNVLKGIEHASMRLQCSRRHLQRVLKNLCGQGRIIKTAKGTYQLVLETKED